MGDHIHCLTSQPDCRFNGSSKRYYKANPPESMTNASLARDVKVMGLVGLAHAASHYFHLVLPPLFPILKDEYGVSYAALGALPS